MTWISIKWIAPACALTLLFAADVSMAQQSQNEEVYQLANRVRKRIVTLNNYGVFDTISFGIQSSADDYTVVLKGFASRPTLKSPAEKVVARIETVGTVINDIEVLPNSSQDEDIRLQAYARIYGHPSLSRYNPNRGTPVYGVRRSAVFGVSSDPPLGPHPIHIIVNRCDITLEGAVDIEMDKNIAGVQANSVSGAFAVTNNLEVLRPNKGEKGKKNKDK